MNIQDIMCDQEVKDAITNLESVLDKKFNAINPNSGITMDISNAIEDIVVDTLMSHKIGKN